MRPPPKISIITNEAELTEYANFVILIVEISSYFILFHIQSPTVKIKPSVYFKELLWQRADKNIYPNEPLDY